jgi:hypothetical protein
MAALAVGYRHQQGRRRARGQQLQQAAAGEDLVVRVRCHDHQA